MELPWKVDGALASVAALDRPACALLLKRVSVRGAIQPQHVKLAGQGLGISACENGKASSE
jgi:hypothetical protein